MSALAHAGPAAAQIAAVWWAMLAGGLAILVGVVGLALYAALRSPERRARARPRLLVIGGGLIFPTAVLAVLLGYGVGAGRSLLPQPADPEVFRVEVRGHQWWWEVGYPRPGGEWLHSANEIHIPAGRPVEILVSTGDVIHSFWIPRLGGKIDAIPGRTNAIRLQADGPGTFRGQCAEFCGAQHARMAIQIEAHEPAALARRLALLGQQRPVTQEGGMAGRRAFEEHCAACHSRDARERNAAGPNLADLRHRAALGAGTVANGPRALRDWLLRHQALKPGNRMPPPDGIDPRSLDAIADYLETGP